MQYLQYVVFGLVTGTILLLGTVGFSMIRRVDNFLNIAHGQMVALGGFFGYTFYQELNLPFVLASLAAMVATGLLGWISYKLIFSPIRDHGPLYLLFTSVGVAFVIHGAIEMIWGTTPKTFRLPQLFTVRIGEEYLASGLEVIIIATAFAAVGLLHLLLTRTRTGIAIRAMSSEFNLARVRGVNTEAVSGVVWIIGSALAGLAGILTGAQGAVFSDMGWVIILVILSASVLGGLGSIYGVMIGAVLIGIGMDFSVNLINPAYRYAFAFVVIMLVLAVRPQGIFGGGRSE
ncbi:MAG: branched-chain amino acid ABC transporter permease [Thermoleophilia bacterium]|nr:branched-chain amino acid ABC transporter permease [Thermoleophilia bacterium]